MSKRVEKRVEFASSSFPQILSLVNEGFTVNRISKIRKTSKQAVYKSLNKLLKKAYVRKIGKIYVITEGGLKFLVRYSTPSKSNDIRLHKVAIKVRILSKPSDWEARRNKILSLNNYNSREIRLKNNKQVIFNEQNIRVRTTTQSIIFHFPNIIAKTYEIAFNEVLDLLEGAIIRIENLFNIILKKDRYINMEVISQHASLMNNYLAKEYNKKGNKFLVTDNKNELRLIIDMSLNLDEFEAIHPIHTPEDIMKVQDYFRDLILKEHYKPSEVALILTKISQEIQAHLFVVNEIRALLPELTELIKLLKDKK